MKKQEFVEKVKEFGLGFYFDKAADDLSQKDLDKLLAAKTLKQFLKVAKKVWKSHDYAGLIGRIFKYDMTDCRIGTYSLYNPLFNRDLKNVRFVGTTLVRADFLNVNLTDCVFEKCRLSFVDFEGVEFVRTKMVDCMLDYCKSKTWPTMKRCSSHFLTQK